MSFIDKLGVYIGSPSRRHNMTYASKEQTDIHKFFYSIPFAVLGVSKICERTVRFRSLKSF